MAKSSKILEENIEELNAQIDQLTEILDMIVDKMGRIEQASAEMQIDLREDLRFIGNEEIDNDR